MKVAELMTSPVHTISSDRSVMYASERMAALKVGSLVVVDHGETIGIITSRDARSAHPNRIVADAMTGNPICVPSSTYVWDALRLMEDHQVERLLVTDRQEVVGLVTREALKVKISEMLDPLTGLYRASYIQIVGTDLLQKRQRFRLMFVDLNNFGEINKLHGHPMGDDIIRGFADKLKSLTGEHDYVSRYAGDEFVIITLREDREADDLEQLLEQPASINGIDVSVAIGVVDGGTEPDFFFEHVPGNCKQGKSAVDFVEAEIIREESNFSSKPSVFLNGFFNYAERIISGVSEENRIISFTPGRWL